MKSQNLKPLQHVSLFCYTNQSIPINHHIRMSTRTDSRFTLRLTVPPPPKPFSPAGPVTPKVIHRYLLVFVIVCYCLYLIVSGVFKRISVVSTSKLLHCKYSSSSSGSQSNAGIIIVVACIVLLILILSATLTRCKGTSRRVCRRDSCQNNNKTFYNDI